MVLASVLVEMLPRLAEQVILECRDAIEVDVVIRKLRNAFQSACGKKSVAHEAIRRDHQRISGV